ncbi:MAG: helix-turn-helix domain-containing protein [Ruminococcaceae bacterium]|nr:helix-turn-helix domain-containing protein [Oscillospiraceae bacterium]
MSKAIKELQAVDYSAAAIKVKKFYCEPQTLCFRLHWHDRIEIIRVKSGKMTIELGEDTFTICQNQMIIFPPRMAHKGYTTDTVVDYDVLMFDIRSFFNDTAVCSTTLPLILEGKVKFKNSIKDFSTVAICDEICNNNNPDSLEIISLVYKLFFDLFQKHISENNSKTQTKAREIIDYIEQNYSHDLNTEALSKKFGYSNEHFCRKFKEATGITPMTYLKIFRLEEALKMLKSGEFSISEIATRCGFNDANYFTRCFKSHYGVPPKSFKK